ncbi:winged helix-turn-helix transcriptional regulator [Nocardia pneumoniae]|uniref:winged helix-turn-helix transcriptional regulator n=1 Tax=Nocardia pneumoniae TaxID=228601 RepID=UPI0006841C9B|nr:helix-turn-helix domain-containing protein [Nocardia pneumoniae]
MSQPVAHDKLPVAPGKSGCPINMTIELLGDRWSLIVLRDIMFGGKTHFRELLAASIEGIASNILASRLAKLVDAGLLTRDDDPSHRQKVEYHLTEAAIQLVPVMAQLGAWGARWLDTEPELTVRAELLAAGGPPLWERFMAELRATHLAGAPIPADGVLAELTAAYLEAAGRSHQTTG